MSEYPIFLQQEFTAYDRSSHGELSTTTIRRPHLNPLQHTTSEIWWLLSGGKGKIIRTVRCSITYHNCTQGPAYLSWCSAFCVLFGCCLVVSTMQYAYIRNLLSFGHYINMCNKISAHVVFFCFLDFLGLLFNFLLLYVMRLSHLNKDYLLTYLLTYCLVTLVSEMTYYVSSGTLNSTHSLRRPLELT